MVLKNNYLFVLFGLFGVVFSSYFIVYYLGSDLVITENYVGSCELVVYVVISYTFKTDNFTLCVSNGSTVFDIMNSTLNISYLSYSGLGYFITSINGVSQNNTHYWIYFVDGVYANKGVSSYRIYENHTTILWVLKDISSF